MVHFSKIAFSAAVQRQQTRMGTRDAMAQLTERAVPRDTLTLDVVDFICARTSLYIASASADGQPYMQHRGGRAGFVRIVDETTLAIPEYTGNRQYITQGNLSENPRAMLFLMNHAAKRRIKIWGEAHVTDDAEVVAGLNGPDQPNCHAAILFDILAWDENCPRFIPAFTDEREVEALRARIAELEVALSAAQA